MVTPENLHCNAHEEVLKTRSQTLEKAWQVYRERFANGVLELLTPFFQHFLETDGGVNGAGLKRKTSLPVSPPRAKRSVLLIGGESGSGISFNLVPDRAFFTIDRRFNPDENFDQVKKELMEVINKEKSRGIEIEVETLQQGESSLANPQDKVGLALKQSIREVTGKVPRFELCPGLCEIRFFNNREIPAYAYGPGRLEVSHGPQEYVKISDVLNCAMIYALTAVRLLT